jgi:hypothetical protein
MKTSDKILLYTTVSFIGIFVVVDLLHYINYRRGNILDFAAIERLDYEKHEEEGVHWLVLDGPMRTNFYPADRLKIDVPRAEGTPIQIRRVNDTLFVSLAAPWTRSAHNLYGAYGDYPAVRVFFPVLKGIRLINGFAVLDNSEGKKGISVALELNNTQCWIGRYNNQADTVGVVEPWDSVSVKGIDCNFVVNRQAHVKAVDLRLDAKSEMQDRFSLIDTGYIHSEITTSLHLQGRNINKLRLDEVDHPTP